MMLFLDPLAHINMGMYRWKRQEIGGNEGEMTYARPSSASPEQDAGPWAKTRASCPPGRRSSDDPARCQTPVSCQRCPLSSVVLNDQSHAPCSLDAACLRSRVGTGLEAERRAEKMQRTYLGSEPPWLGILQWQRREEDETENSDGKGDDGVNDE